MKSFITLFVAVALLAPGCKKDKKDKTPDTTATKPADDVKPVDPKPTPTPVEPTAPVVPTVELTGTPAENMTWVFKAGVDAIKSASPTEAAAVLNGMLAKYKVKELREKASEAKAAGKGATKEQIEEFKTLKDAYKARAEELGKQDAAAFGPAAAAWAEAWGIS